MCLSPCTAQAQGWKEGPGSVENMYGYMCKQPTTRATTCGALGLLTAAAVRFWRSCPGQGKATYSWHRKWMTKSHSWRWAVEGRGEESTEFAQNELAYKRSAVNSACQVSVRRGEFPWAACLGCPPLTETLEALGTCYTPTGSRDRACDVDDAVKEARASEGGRGEGKGGEGTGTTNQRNLEQCPQKVNCLK